MKGIVKPVFADPAKHLYRLFTEPNYFTYNRLYSKLKSYPRYKECQVRIDNYNLLIPDAASFLSAYQEIFLEQIYKFKTNTTTPKILDLGANIGLSILFFKSLYPEAKITAFEADPQIFNYLKKNVNKKGYSDVKLIEGAIWHENTTLNFVSEGADSGQVAKSNNGIEVKAIDIAQLLNQQQFDFIKMDIEGAEEYVLPRCQGLLDSVQYLFIEYHSRINCKQKLDRILNILAKENFRVYLPNNWQKPTPFLGLSSYMGFDFQTNIYAWKESIK